MSYLFGKEFHFTDFRTIDSIPTCCFNISSGLSTSNNIALNYKIKVFDDFNLGIALGYSMQNGKVNSFKNEYISIDGDEYFGKFEYAVESEIGLLNFGIDVDYRLFDRFYLNSRFGLSFVSSFDYYQYEKLVVPTDRGYFVKPDGSKSRTRNEFKGTLSPKAMNNIVAIGAYYELPLNKTKTLNLVPSLDLVFQFGEIIPKTNWHFSSYKIGLGINYYFHKDSLIRIDEKNIDRTLLLAPTFVANNSEKLKNIIQYNLFNFDIDLFEVGLNVKKKNIKYKKLIPVDDSLRFYYKFDKFSDVKDLSLNLSDDNQKESIPLKLSENKIEFSLSNILSKYSDNLVANLKLTNRSRVYVKNAFTMIDKDYFSNSVILNFEELNKYEGNVTLFRWKGALDREDNLELIVNNIHNKNKIKYVYSNTELGLKLVKLLDNAKIVYNPDNDILRVLKELIENDNYIIIYEN